MGIDCAACIMGYPNARNAVVVEIDGDFYACHLTCLTPGRQRRPDAHPLTDDERQQLGIEMGRKS